MDSYTEKSAHNSLTSGLFLPLALRFAASFALLVLHLCLDMELPESSVGEWLYVSMLGALFLESAFEAARSTTSSSSLFVVPSRPWVLLNLFLLCLLIALLVSFHGVDKTGLAALYVFPVLASAFYVGISTIIGIGLISVIMYAFCVVLFSNGLGLAFGFSGVDSLLQPLEQIWLIGFTSFQVVVATLVAAAIRKRLEALGSNLSLSAAVVDEISSLYRNVVESMSLGLVTIDLKGIVTSANHSAERILQTRISLWQPMATLDAIERAMQGVIPGVCRFEQSLTTANGAEKIIGGTISPLMDSENQQTGFLLLFEDLTDIKAMEARMLLSERLAAIGELSTELAHEMRTPLASIQGCIQILRKPDADKNIVDRAMTILLRESERIGAVVSDFLELAKPRELNMELLWLPKLLEEALAAWDTDSRFATLSPEIEKPPEVWIHGDALACHQILTNLLSNSRKAVSNITKPIIRITHKIQGDTLELTVSDNGTGMNKSQLNDLFVPFRSNFSEGTGVGMSIVFQFTQRMGWKIDVSSEAGVGTTITMTIPIGVE
jgi:signal transduction histidine kinase